MSSFHTAKIYKERLLDAFKCTKMDVIVKVFHISRIIQGGFFAI